MGREELDVGGDWGIYRTGWLAAQETPLLGEKIKNSRVKGVSNQAEIASPEGMLRERPAPSTPYATLRAGTQGAGLAKTHGRDCFDIRFILLS